VEAVYQEVGEVVGFWVVVTEVFQEKVVAEDYFLVSDWEEDMCCPVLMGLA
jgi:hypothetical protein